ncbi:hypothetical protein BJY16_006967 [Actinoplanes octamycinicus]|uniref:Type II toxin-antitoxin system RelE/ParE family toxin n=1 Tax=Actinoplanes octamycinicus TaxID=135948 RepID=A0A7W7MAX7_9ACTN|nr:type II toxin-antitoxin system RelE/ParE family toxin [Actinoplanes octamycinicus]MBB4743508.1 hypothetical protein [Actinoplanes octamycinicus]GIE62506.1 hypothetical protein Aoc01nite_79080 [Actinoplanes octamycinicus]
MTWRVVIHPEAELELAKLPTAEAVALLHATEKLMALGPTLPFPHTSNVNGAEKLRELRPRAGSSPWRALYRRIGTVFVIAAVAPEAAGDHRGFHRAVQAAEKRLQQLQED